MAKQKTKDQDKNKDKGKVKGKAASTSSGAAARKRNEGQTEIAAAEKALAKALRDVERARHELSKRERDLSGLMEKHGRMPSMTAAETSSVITEPLLDQDQVIVDPAADTTSTASDSESDEAEATSIVALFDQMQVIR